MYRIDKSNNRISRLKTKSFSSLGFSERNHLQEWLANQPDALGEELLIIQKEFDGFDDTRERLDLLALDKDGNLVLIENKLDDSGRDVVWQAIKYASYCSNLSKAQIVEVYQNYLNRYCGGGDSTAMLCEFLDITDLKEIILNGGSNQRLMFVAANFRKEVTSTALWLLSHGIQLQCFKVTPYAMSEELFLNVEQIIPTPEAKELMIGMSVKEAEEKSTVVELKNRHKLRLSFWEKALEAINNSECTLYTNISPSKDHWLSAGSGVSACPYSLIFAKQEVRVDLCFAKADRNENKQLFDFMLSHKDEIEHGFGQSLEWLRLDAKKSSRIQFSHSVDGFNQDSWSDMIDWLVARIALLEKATKKLLKEGSKLL